jgi:murein DD-endopeptidase MepM/ murein hydrolase activator NlpD
MNAKSMAKKNKFIIDPHSLKIFKVKKSAKTIIRHIVIYFFAIAVIFFISLWMSFYYFDSPREKTLTRELSQMRRQFDLLNNHIELLEEIVEDIHQRDNDLYRMVFEAEPHTDSLSFESVHTDISYVSAINVRTIRSVSERLNNLSTTIYSESKSLDELYEMAQNKQERLLCMPAILPINKKLGKVYSGFGMRFHPIVKAYRMHTGIDLTAPKGTPIYATGDGVVETAGMPQGYGGYGLLVVINHGFSYQSLYAHCSKVAVRVGQKVKRGDIIAYVGSTGTSTGSHCHYEVRINEKPVDPVYYFFNDLTPEEYEEILKKSQEINQALS